MRFHKADVLKIAAVLLVTVIILCTIISDSTQEEIAGSVVRLHILANSDSEADQALKLKVRDAILGFVTDRYPQNAGKAEAEAYLKNSLPEIQRIARDVLAANGSYADVKASFGRYAFPTKAYENVSLPAGIYEAVRVEIGEAKGQNWWCVMFPPLCLADSGSLKMTDEAMLQLKKELGDGNYELITELANTADVKVKVRFRLVELVENSKMRLAELIQNMF